ncbi:MAG: PAS domain S-box protein [Deltaproteobacteria bacterium]|nr:PAS domain S-box protein [Deltaproteobacteria bacterium]
MRTLLLCGERSSAPGVLEAQIRALGHEVRVVHDAGDALALQRDQLFPLVIAEHTPPALDLVAFCRELRLHPRGLEPVIMALVEDATPGAVEPLLHAGVTAWLPTGAGSDRLRLALVAAVYQAERVHEGIRQGRGLMREAVNNAGVVVFAYDQRGTFTLSEGGGLRALGLESGQVVGRSFEEAFGDEPEVTESCRRALEGREQRGLVHLRGLDLDWDCWWGPMRGEDGRLAGVLGVAMNVTGQRRAEAAQLRTEASFRNLIERCPVAVLVHRGERVCYANPTAVRLLGRADAGELLGRSLFELVHAEDRQRLESAISAQRPGRGDPPLLDLRLRRVDVGETTVEAYTLDVTFEGEPAWLLVMHDVTERRQLQAQLMQSDRLASVGTLAAGVAHEINNPLSYVVGNLGLLAERLPKLATLARRGQAADEAGAGASGVAGQLAAQLDELSELVQEAVQGGDRVRRIVRDLRFFSRGDDERRVPVELAPVLDATLRLAENEIRHRARLVRDLGPPVRVMGNSARLGQVFLNLVLNAAQALPDGQADRHEIRLATSVPEEGWVEVVVADTGPGIPRELLNRVMDPFVTTKPVGVGTGLGLSMCHGIVSHLGGALRVESEEGRGTRVTVRLPTTDETPSGEHAAVAAAPLAQRYRLLVLDDEPLVGVMVRRMLTEAFEVETETTALRALERLRSGQRFDLVLCDLMMPVLSGMDFFAELERLDGEQARRVVFLTGGAFTPRAREFLDRTPNPCLEKPFELEEFRRLVGELLPPRPLS